MVSDPMVSDPMVSDPMVSDPMVSDPMVSDPMVSDPMVSEWMVREMNNQRIAAIFDVDGTLITNATLERIFIKFLWRRGQLGWREFVRWLGAAINVLMGKAF